MFWATVRVGLLAVGLVVLFHYALMILIAHKQNKNRRIERFANYRGGRCGGSCGSSASAYAPIQPAPAQLGWRPAPANVAAAPANNLAAAPAAPITTTESGAAAAKHEREARETAGGDGDYEALKNSFQEWLQTQQGGVEGRVAAATEGGGDAAYELPAAPASPLMPTAAAASSLTASSPGYMDAFASVQASPQPTATSAPATPTGFTFGGVSSAAASPF
jgi:hypothetical protein